MIRGSPKRVATYSKCILVGMQKTAISGGIACKGISQLTGLVSETYASRSKEYCFLTCFSKSVCSLFFDPFELKIYDYNNGMEDLKDLKVT